MRVRALIAVFNEEATVASLGPGVRHTRRLPTALISSIVPARCTGSGLSPSCLRLGSCGGQAAKTGLPLSHRGDASVAPPFPRQACWRSLMSRKRESAGWPRPSPTSWSSRCVRAVASFANFPLERGAGSRPFWEPSSGCFSVGIGAGRSGTSWTRAVPPARGEGPGPRACFRSFALVLVESLAMARLVARRRVEVKAGYSEAAEALLTRIRARRGPFGPRSRGPHWRLGAGRGRARRLCAPTDVVVSVRLVRNPVFCEFLRRERRAIGLQLVDRASSCVSCCGA